MLFKIALHNIKRSFKDYTVYFLTLTLGVCLFYVFNSIDAQKDLFVDNGVFEVIKGLALLMQYLSIVVSVVLAGLIIFANSFLIRRRKKEFGIYMSLGMKRRKISLILIIETFMVGLVALAIGTIIGIVLSQGMALLTANLLSVRLNEYKMVFSMSSLIRTIISFGIVFLIVMIFNYIAISKYRLYNLIYGSRKNEKVVIRNPIILTILFIISVGIMITAYCMVYDLGFVPSNIRFFISIILGIIGTFLFFFSISGFILVLSKSSKKFYFRKLNMFLIRQINNKIVTNFVSMSIISLLLFLALSASMTTFLYREALESQLTETTEYDATLMVYSNNYDREAESRYHDNFIDEFNKNSGTGIKLNSNIKAASYFQYSLEMYIDEFLSQYIQYEKDEYYNDSLLAIKINDYNNLRKLKNQEEISLKDNEIYILSNLPESVESEFYNITKGKIEYMGKKYNIINDKFDRRYPKSGYYANTGWDYLIFVVPESFNDMFGAYYDENHVHYDSIPEGEDAGKYQYQEYGTVIVNMIFTGSEEDKLAADKQLHDIDEWTCQTRPNDSSDMLFAVSVTQEYIMGIYGTGALFVYIGIYIGLTFILASVAVLAMQQLSDANDSAERFKSLKRMGISDKMMSGVILKQVLIYFTLPLGLAVIDTLVALKTVDKTSSSYWDFSMFDYILSAIPLVVMGTIVLIFAVYIITTFISYKNLALRR